MNIAVKTFLIYNSKVSGISYLFRIREYLFNVKERGSDLQSITKMELVLQIILAV